MAALRDEASGHPIGSITPVRLRFLVADDTDSYVTGAARDREGMEIG